jgi:hypothetical protein
VLLPSLESKNKANEKPACKRWQVETFFDPEYGGDMFYRNVGSPEARTLRNRRCENLRSCEVIILFVIMTMSIAGHRPMRTLMMLL